MADLINGVPDVKHIKKVITKMIFGKEFAIIFKLRKERPRI